MPMKYSDYSSSCLFTLISNGEPASSIINHAFNHPEDVGTWIISREETNKGCESVGVDVMNEESILWKYLPCHLVCLQHNPSKEVLLVMRDVFPKGLKMRDYQGNLPIHYLLAEGCGDEEILDIVADEEYSCLHERDGEGRQMLDIIDQSSGSDNFKDVMKRWFEKRDAREFELSPQCNSIKSNDHISSDSNENASGDVKYHHHLQNELLVTRTKMGDIDNENQKLRWECDAKDQTIDSLTAQLISLEKKLKRGLNKSAEAIADSSQSDQMQDDLDSQDNKNDDVRALKKKMDLDANIICSQEEKIKDLKSELADSLKRNFEAERENDKLQKQIEMFDGKIHQHDDVVSHVRKVSRILQDELDTKGKDIITLQKQMDSVLADNDDLKQKLTLKEREAEKKLESFQTSVRNQSKDLSDLLKTLKEKEAENEARITKDLRIANDRLAVKDEDVATLKRELEATRRKISNLENILNEKDQEINLMLQDSIQSGNDEELLALRKELEAAIARNFELTNTFAEKEKEMNSKLRSMQDSLCSSTHQVISSSQVKYNAVQEEEENQSRTETDEEIIGMQKQTPSSNPIADAIDIRERQIQLQNELRDIYSQIKSAIPGHIVNNGVPLKSSESSSEASREIWGESKTSQSGQGVRLLTMKDSRPWRKELQHSDEIYNTEAWGQKTQTNTIYDI